MLKLVIKSHRNALKNVVFHKVVSSLFFSLYINTVPVDNLSSNNIDHSTYLFADDIADSYIFQTIGNQIEKCLNDRLKVLKSWLNTWRLKIAPNKCNYIIFSQNFKSEYLEKTSN